MKSRILCSSVTKIQVSGGYNREMKKTTEDTEKRRFYRRARGEKLKNENKVLPQIIHKQEEKK